MEDNCKDCKFQRTDLSEFPCFEGVDEMIDCGYCRFWKPKTFWQKLFSSFV